MISFGHPPSIQTIYHRLFAGKGPLYIAITALLVTVGLMESHILRSTQGALIFPLDDSFTRLSIAKNLAFKMVWGISQYEFTAASSSILYPILLAIIFFIFGAYPIIALLTNIALALIFLTMAQRWLVKQNLSFTKQTLILLAAIFLIPLPVIVVSGMEHTLQLLLSFLFITRFYKEYTRGKLSRFTYLIGTLLVANRYEGIILIAAACTLLLIQKKTFTAFKLLGWSLLPLLAFGAFALSRHSHFPPNPLVIQPNAPLNSFAGLYLAWIIGNIVIFGSTLLTKYGQALFKRAVPFSRGLTGLALLLFILLCSFQSLNVFQNIGQACINIYQQQYQAGQLLRRYYNRSSVAVDNIGATSFFTEGRDLDLNAHPLHVLDSLNRMYGPPIAICYDRRPLPSLEQHWIKIASWTIPDNFLCKDPTLTIYATDSFAIKNLKKNLLEFQPHLPPDVRVRYY